jgi:Kef-type K+ transport system membrane component KefB
MTGLTFLVIFLLLMTLMAVIPQILKRFHIPTVVAMMLIGIVIGPNALDLIRILNHLLGRGLSHRTDICGPRRHGAAGIAFSEGIGRYGS